VCVTGKLTVRDQLTSPSKESLLNLLRLDTGSVSRDYLFHLSSELTASTRPRIALIHHNPVQYGPEVCANKFAPLLLETLFSRGVQLLLHGHVHLSEDSVSPRPFLEQRTYAVPCPTLTSEPTSGHRGLNVLLLGKDGDTTRASILVWPLSTASGFNVKTLTVRYGFELGQNVNRVTHFPLSAAQ
jgi:hypothetical protein